MLPGDRLKKVREFLGLTQCEFAKGLSFKEYKVRDIEVGKQKLSAGIALKVQEVYAISFKWLMDGEGEMKLPVCLEENENYLALPEPYKDIIKLLQENPGKVGELRALITGYLEADKKK